jgi:thiamine transport system substrate-binding protein
MAFIATVAFQRIIPTTNWMFPAAKTASPLPEEFSTIRHPEKPLMMDSAVVEQNRKLWTAEWLGAVGR